MPHPDGTRLREETEMSVLMVNARIEEGKVVEAETVVERVFELLRSHRRTVFGERLA